MTTHPGQACTPRCWTPTPCPCCGNWLPPHARALPPDMNLSSCCEEARIHPSSNPRHLWTETDPERVIA